MDRRWFLDNLWRWKCGLPERPEPLPHRVTAEQARANWSDRFVQLMRNRMMLGIYRYGSFRDPRQPAYDRIGSVLHRLAQYRETGNLEHLVDAANLCLIEFEVSRHPRRHFVAIDDGSHVAILDP
jgi:hypothetical protein